MGLSSGPGWNAGGFWNGGSDVWSPTATSASTGVNAISSSYYGFRRARIIARERATDGPPSIAAAADNRLMTVMGLLEDRDICASADRRGDPRPRVVDDLGAHRRTRQQTSNKTRLSMQPRLDRPVAIGDVQRLTTVVADIPADHHLAVVTAHNPFPAGQRDQSRRHAPIVRDRPTARQQPLPPTRAHADGDLGS